MLSPDWWIISHINQSRNEHLVKCLAKGDWTSHPSVTLSQPIRSLFWRLACVVLASLTPVESLECSSFIFFKCGNIDQLQWHCSLYQGSRSHLFLFKRFWLARSWSERWTEAQNRNSQDCYVAFRILANCFGMRNQWQSADVAAVYKVTCSAGMQTHFDVACLLSLACLVATPQRPATKAVKVFICQFFHSLKLIKRLGHLFFFLRFYQWKHVAHCSCLSFGSQQQHCATERDVFPLPNNTVFPLSQSHNNRFLIKIWKSFSRFLFIMN